MCGEELELLGADQMKGTGQKKAKKKSIFNGIDADV